METDASKLAKDIYHNLVSLGFDSRPYVGVVYPKVYHHSEFNPHNNVNFEVKNVKAIKED